MTNIIGIDICKFGCLVSLSDPNNYLLMPMMENRRDGVDMDKITKWHRALLGDGTTYNGMRLGVCIEQQWTFGVEGRVSIAYLMLQYGQLWGYYQGFEPRIVPVRAWKGHHNIKSRYGGKQQAIDVVAKLYPDLNWPKLQTHRHGLSDAILIALYGRDTE